MPPKKDVKISIRIKAETKAALQVLSDADSRKLSDFIRIELEKLAAKKKENQ